MSAIMQPGYGQRLWVARDGIFPTDPYAVVIGFKDGTDTPVYTYQNFSNWFGFNPPNAIGWNPIRQQCWMAMLDGTVTYADAWLQNPPTVVRNASAMPAGFNSCLQGAVVGDNVSSSDTRELFVLVENHVSGLKIVAVNMDTGAQATWATLDAEEIDIVDIVPLPRQPNGIVHPRGVIITGWTGTGDNARSFLASVYSTGIFYWKVWPPRTQVNENTKIFTRISGAWATSGAIVAFAKETVTDTSYTDNNGKFFDIQSGDFNLCTMAVPLSPSSGSEASFLVGNIPTAIVEDHEFSFVQASVGGVKRTWGGSIAVAPSYYFRANQAAPTPVGDLSTKIGLFRKEQNGPYRQIWGPAPDQGFGTNFSQNYLGGAVPGPGAMEWIEM